MNYQVVSSAVFTATKPNLSVIIDLPRCHAFAIKEADLMEFIVNLSNWTFSSLAALDAQIIGDIRSQAVQHLFNTSPVLSATNPIKDVLVNHSQPSGQTDVWRGIPGFAIHPVTQPNWTILDDIPIAVAPHIVNRVTQGWMSASVVADNI